MGELAEDFAFMKKMKLEERAEKEPTRFEYAIKAIHDAGFLADRVMDDDKMLLVNGYIKFWPYTGWYSGKRIGSGRGIKKLIDALAQAKD